MRFLAASIYLHLPGGNLSYFTIVDLRARTIQTARKAGIHIEIQKAKEVKITLRSNWLSNMDLNKEVEKAILTIC